jgi:hypothetical protein
MMADEETTAATLASIADSLANIAVSLESISEIFELVTHRKDGDDIGWIRNIDIGREG